MMPTRKFFLHEIVVQPRFVPRAAALAVYWVMGRRGSLPRRWEVYLMILSSCRGPRWARLLIRHVRRGPSRTGHIMIHQ